MHSLLKIIHLSQRSMLVFLITLLTAMTSFIPPVSAAAPGADTTDLNNVDLRVFVKYISEITGKKIIIDPKASGKVNVIAPHRLNASEAMAVLDSVLEVLGFTTIDSGSSVKIVSKAHARSKEVPLVRNDGATKPVDHVITKIIRLKNADAELAKRVLIPMMPKSGVIMSHRPTNTLILTDTGKNIRRLEMILADIDVPGNTREIKLVPLHHAAAATVAASLNRLFASPQTKPTGLIRNNNVPKFIADERTNSLLVLASKPELPKILETLQEVDRKSTTDAGNIHVVYLKYANAEDLAAVLTKLPQKDQDSTKKGPPTGLPEEIKVLADKATNSLVITADKDNFMVMKEVIDKLDIPRKMVFLEAAIMEVSFAKNFKLGVEWRMGGKTANTFLGGGFGGSRDAPFSNMDAIPSLPGGLSVGVIGQGITVGDVVFPNLGAMIEAYKSDRDVNILSTPQILTTDNQEAEIKVGENVPYIVRQETSQTDRDYSSFEYRDVGVTLKITPQISQNGLVRLKVFQETVKLKNPDAVSDKPTTLKRSAKTTVMVQDKKTVVIGGIIGEDKTSGEFKVPILGDIPVLGRLFTTETESTEKTNLYIFITPHIIDTPEQAASMAGEKRHTMEQLSKNGIAASVEAKFAGQDMLLADQGYLALQARDIKAAERFFNAALAINPDNPYALFNRALLHEAGGRKEAAARDYNRLRSQPKSVTAHASSSSTSLGRPLVDLAAERLLRLDSPRGAH